MVLFVEFVVLLFVAALWWLARRDLTSLAAQRQAPTVAHLEELRATLERLVDVLEERAAAAEARLARRIEEANRLSPVEPVSRPNPQPSNPGIYAQVYQLAESGMVDVAQIAKRTGLGQAEVEMVLGLRLPDSE